MKNNAFKDINEDYLYPLKSKRNMLPAYMSADIETMDRHGNKSWTDFYMVGFYDGSKYRKYYLLDHFLDDVFACSAGIPIFMHYLDFDGMFILDNLFKRRDIKIKPVMAGSLMLSLEIEKDGEKYEFRNSFSVLPRSLAELCESFGEHPKVSLDRLEERNYWDCVALFNIIGKYNEWLGGNISKTMALTSMRTWRSGYLKRKVCNNRRIDQITRKTYHGGLNELYKFNTDPDMDIHIYDVNSMYPAVMHDNPFPVGKMRKTYRHDSEAAGVCLITAFEYEDIPFLPEFDGKTYYMSGRKRVWITTPEYDYLKEKGMPMRYEVGYETPVTDFIFRDYVAEFYRRKSEAKEKNDKASYMISKLLLNSLYGKFGQKPSVREYCVNPDEDFFDRKTQCVLPDGSISFNIIEKRQVFMVPAIAAMVTGLARVKIHSYASSVDPDILYYIDTDSCMLSEKKLENSKELGKMSLEKSCRPFLPIAPKFYIAGNKVSMKGIPTPKMEIEDKGEKKRREFLALRDNFMALLQGKELKFSQGINKFRTAIKQNPHNMVQLKTISKSIKSPYDKRQIVSGYSTIPWDKEKMRPSKNYDPWQRIRSELISVLERE